MITVLVDFPVLKLYKKYDAELVDIMLTFTFNVVYEEIINNEGHGKDKSKELILEKIKLTPLNVVEALRLFDIEEVLPGLNKYKHDHEDFDYDNCIKCVIVEEKLAQCNTIALDILKDIEFTEVIHDKLKTNYCSMTVVPVDSRTVKVYLSNNQL